jgi:hypothetical protein
LNGPRARQSVAACAFLAAAIFCAATESAAQSAPARSTFEALVYKQGTGRGVLLFKKYNEIVTNGNETASRHVYTLEDGTPAAYEEVVKKDGRFKEYNIAFYSAGSSGNVRRDGDSLVFTHNEGGRTTRGTAPFMDDIQCGPCLEVFVVERWTEITKGERVRFSFPVLEYKRTVPFGFTRAKKSPYAAPGVVVVRMAPASVLLDLLIEPVYFVYDEKAKRILEVHGPSILKVRENGKWVNASVDIYYTHD